MKVQKLPKGKLLKIIEEEVSRLLEEGLQNVTAPEGVPTIPRPTQKQSGIERGIAVMLNDLLSRVEELERADEDTRKLFHQILKKMGVEMIQESIEEIRGQRAWYALLTPEEKSELGALANTPEEEYGEEEEKTIMSILYDLQRREREQRGEAAAAQRPSSEIARAKAETMKDKTLPNAARALNKDKFIPGPVLGGGEPKVDPNVDPFAKTAKARRLTQEHLRQIIKEELEVLLTDDEVLEMFGIDLTEEKDSDNKIKIST